MIAIDTNIWIYSHDNQNAAKKEKAVELIETVAPVALLWQVGCEFIAASRKIDGFAMDEAWAALADMQAMADVIALPDAADWLTARDLVTNDMLSFWDALLLSTAMRHNVSTLYTEDMGSPRTIRSVALVNPL